MDAQALYDQMIQEGVTPRLAEMLALQQPPGIKTGKQFVRANNQQIDAVAKKSPRLAKMIVDQARASGVSISGKEYKSMLARYPGDPAAWVSSTDDAMAVLKTRKDLNCYGDVNYRCPEPENVETPGNTYRVSEKIVNSRVLDAIEDEPEKYKTRNSRMELKEKLTETLSGAGYA